MVEIRKSNRFELFSWIVKYQTIFYFIIIAWKAQSQSPADLYPVIPLPAFIEPRHEFFRFRGTTLISSEPNTMELKRIAADFVKDLNEKIAEPIVFASEDMVDQHILLLLDPAITNQEGYDLNISQSQITLKASNPKGIYYGLQTLKQLFPPHVLSHRTQWQNPKVPCCRIIDQPRFPYRGAHLDVSRHFFNVQEVKQFLDGMALHKLNYFHWHLSDDQGWRIESEVFPKLHQIGAYRKGTLQGKLFNKTSFVRYETYGGYYTKQEIRDIIDYARQRNITVIPEIDVPGHSLAMLAAYPELACFSGSYEVATGWGIFKDVLCTQEETFTFLNTLLNEVMDLFPAAYIHVGGDENLKSRWRTCTKCAHQMSSQGLSNTHELQLYFIKRIEQIVHQRGRRIIGWDEIRQGGSTANAVIMSWHDMTAGFLSAMEGYNAIMTPKQFCYFDKYQLKDRNAQDLSMAGYLPISKVYQFDPIPSGLSDDRKHFILGGQANLWTEYINNYSRLQYMAYPRLCAMSEVLWTEKELQNYPDFMKRMQIHFKRLEAMGINYCPQME